MPWRFKEESGEFYGRVDRKDFTEQVAKRGHLKDGQSFLVDWRGEDITGRESARSQRRRTVRYVWKGKSFDMMVQWMGA